MPRPEALQAGHRSHDRPHGACLWIVVSRLVRADFLRGHLDGLLLAVLADAPGHGYELSRRLTERSGGEFGVNEGSLYPALHRLERGGLVRSAWSTGEGRRRRIYRLTSSGRRAVKDTRREWRAFSTAVDRVLG